MNNKILLGIGFLIVILGLIYFSVNIFKPNSDLNSPEGVACTMDAKICPDGSAVGRIAPLCEFAACPVSEEKQSFQKLFYDKSQDIGFEYNEMTGTYVKPQVWPVQTTLSNAAYTCTGPLSSSPVLNGNEYCLRTQSEGAAGTTYKTYLYSYKEGNKLATLKSVFRFPQCLNYDDPQKTDCLQEQAEFTDKTILENMSIVKIDVSKGVNEVGSKFEVLKGTFDCIINEEIDGTKKTTCRRSIKTSDGGLYALDIQDVTIQKDLEINARGKQIVVSGEYTPIELLSSDFWRRYGVKGILTLSNYKIL